MFSKPWHWYRRSPRHWSGWSLVFFNAVRTPSAWHDCRVFPSSSYNSSVFITVAFSCIRCVWDLAPGAILGYCCSKGVDLLVDILMMFWIMTRKVFFNLLMQKERYVAVRYVLGLNFDSCHDNKSHVRFPEWTVSLQTHKECYQIWQILNDDVSRNLDSITGDLDCCRCMLPPGLTKLAVGFFLVLSSDGKTNALLGFVCFVLSRFSVCWKTNWLFWIKNSFARLAEGKKGSWTSSSHFKDVFASDAFSGFSNNFDKTRRTSVEYFSHRKWALSSLIFHFVLVLSVSDSTNSSCWFCCGGQGWELTPV